MLSIAIFMKKITIFISRIIWILLFSIIIQELLALLQHVLCNNSSNKTYFNET